jgi:hypothetical protein
MSRLLAALTDPLLDAEMSAASRRYAASRVAELIAEDPAVSAEQLVDLLRAEADAAQADLRRLRDAG